MKPPVEAPTSRQVRPAGSTPKASRAPSSFSPPRETKRGGISTAMSTSASTRSPGRRSRRAASPLPTRMRPASSMAWARLRVSTRPRVTTSWSRRTRRARGVPSPFSPRGARRPTAAGRAPRRRPRPGCGYRPRPAAACAAGQPRSRAPRSDRPGCRSAARPASPCCPGSPPASPGRPTRSRPAGRSPRGSPAAAARSPAR